MIKLAHKNQQILKNLGLYVLLLIIAFAMLVPLLWLTSTAFKSPTENVFQFPPQFIPEHPTLENFIQVWKQEPFGQYFFNSIVVAALTVSLNVLFSSLAAYPLARLNFVGKNLIFYIIGMYFASLIQNIKFIVRLCHKL